MKVSVFLGTRPEIIKFSLILRKLERLGVKRGWPNPFGDGRMGEKIVDTVMNHVRDLGAPRHKETRS